MTAHRYDGDGIKAKLALLDALDALIDRVHCAHRFAYRGRIIAAQAVCIPRNELIIQDLGPDPRDRIDPQEDEQ